MISFMVLGGPRSGTTWAANWLTTDHTICLHDPLMEFTLARLSQLEYPGKRLGIACTASLLYPQWVNESKAKKLIVYRDVPSMNASLRALGLHEMHEARHLARIEALKGAMLVPYETLFQSKAAETIAEYLGVPFDWARHNLLRQMRIEPFWKSLNVGREAVTDLVKKINEAR